MEPSNLNDVLMESGLDLLSKINNSSKQCSQWKDLDQKLLPSLESKSVVEISGPSRTGKTILVLKYMTKMLLPATHNNLEVGGLSLNVLMVDMELKFAIRILVEEIEYYLNNKLVKQIQDLHLEPGQSKEDFISAIVQDSLSRLHVVYCPNSSENLSLIFQNVETKILSKQLTLDAVIIENILNYFFEDVSVQLCSIAKYLHNLLHKSVFKYMNKFNTLLIYTRYISLIRGRLPSNFITHCIQLSPINYYGIHKCVVNMAEEVYYYRIENGEMVWTDFNEELMEKADEDKEDEMEL